jgi:pimeloyl-[acyl-carrier protein] methyl ester esterase
MTGLPPRLHIESVGSGPPLVLLHGWALHAGLFAPLLPALAPHFRVHAVDLPGHGRSEAVTPYTIDAIVAALERAFGAERERLAVMGWSLGGMIALHWALAHPARIRKLALVNTTPKFVADDAWPHAMAPQTLARFADELAIAYRLTLQRFLTLQVQGSEEGKAALAMLRHELFARGEPSPKVMLRHELFARGEPSPKVLTEALGSLAAADLRKRVPQISIPTLVIAGERDTLTPPAAAQWLAKALPAARLVRIAGAAHAPFLSHREAFTSALLDFLADD